MATHDEPIGLSPVQDADNVFRMLCGQGALFWQGVNPLQVGSHMEGDLLNLRQDFIPEDCSFE